MIDHSLERSTAPDAPGQWAQRLARNTLAVSRPPSTQALPLALLGRRSWLVSLPSRGTASAANAGPSPVPGFLGGDYVNRRAVSASRPTPAALGGLSAPLRLSGRTRLGATRDTHLLPALRTPPAGGEVPKAASAPTRSQATAALPVMLPACLRPASSEAMPGVSGLRRVVPVQAVEVEGRDAPTETLAASPTDNYDSLEERLARRERLDMHR